MSVAGVDVSSRAVDVVWISEETFEATWRRFELDGSDAWERCREIGQVFPPPTSGLWDETLAIGVEVAFGPSSGAVNRCVGAVLVRLPRSLLVKPWAPSEWRKAVGLSGRAGKEDVFTFAHERRSLVESYRVPWPQDACDAYCIALATLRALERQEAA